MRQVAIAFVAALVALLALSMQCGTGTNTCDDSVGPGVACSDSKLCCHYPNSECGGCQCNGSTFVCDLGNCMMTGACAEPSTLESGNACGRPPTAPTCAQYPPGGYNCHSTAPIYPCGATCSCSGAFGQTGTWICTPSACVDAGDAASD